MLNNWSDLGGINTYCNVFGCNATTFYTNAAAQKAYQAYIAFVVNRYKPSSATFSWELCNEPRCHGCDSSVIYNWALTTSGYIKSLDSKHMVALGDEGWLCGGGDGSYAYSCAESVDFAKNIGIATLDYGAFHMYPDQWGYNYSWGNTWIKDHNAVGAEVGKPVVLEEYGAQGADTTAVEQQWQKIVVQDTEIAYDSFWQFGTTLPSRNAIMDNYTIEYGTAEYQTLVIDHVQAMDAKGV
jgi:mannan endo-1,4-beta-mannosidase